MTSTRPPFPHDCAGAAAVAARAIANILAKASVGMVLGAALASQGARAESTPAVRSTAIQAEASRPDDAGRSAQPVPRYIAFDAQGGLIAANPRREVIERISSHGDVHVLAGRDGERGYRDGPANEALFHSPSALAVDKRSGMIYVADSGNRLIRRIDPSGSVTTIAGIPGESGDSDGPLGQAKLDFVRGMAVAGDGSLYFIDVVTIRHLSRDGNVSTLAGNAAMKRHSDQTFDTASDGPGDKVLFGGLSGIAVNATGDVLVADPSGETIRKLSRNGVVTTVAGVAHKFGHADGRGTQATFFLPRAVALDDSGNIYVAEVGNHAIRRIAGDGTVSTFVGGPTAMSRNSPAGEPQLIAPLSIAFDASGALYVADADCVCLRIIDRHGEVSTLGFHQN